MINALKITPTDLLMFRDGRPFNQDDPGGATAQSLFPPPPPTVVGAIRLAIAEQNGFPISWPKQLLGDGVDWQAPSDLGTVSFGALRLLQKNSCGASDELFPAPLHVVIDHAKTCKLLSPAAPQFVSDLGDNVRLAAGTGAGLKTIEGDFVTRQGIELILQGKPPLPEHIVPAVSIFAFETRAGIALNSATRIVEDSALYSAGFVRLYDVVSMLQPVSGLPESLSAFTQRFGGEHRTAIFDLADAPPLPTAQLSGNTYAAIAIAPVYLRAAPVAGGQIPGLPGRLVSVCMAKPVWLGGWDSQNQRPLPMCQIVPAGAVFFMECDKTELPNGNEPLLVGSANKWGFGHCLAAAWPAQGENSK